LKIYFIVDLSIVDDSCILARELFSLNTIYLFIEINSQPYISIGSFIVGALHPTGL
jgi:hypothetical protein